VSWVEAGRAAICLVGGVDRVDRPLDQPACLLTTPPHRSRWDSGVPRESAIHHQTAGKEGPLLLQDFQLM
jgi:hypothetical protein